jgi:hypothetical protein
MSNMLIAVIVVIIIGGWDFVAKVGFDVVIVGVVVVIAGNGWN